MPRLAVCSWSLRPTGPADLVEKIRACGLDAVQLALDPIRRGDWDEAETVHALADAGITIVSGMIEMAGEDYSTLVTIKETGGVRPDTTWPANLEAAKAGAAIAARLGLKLVTFHIGFVPHEASDPERAKLIDRVRQIVATFDAHGISMAFETGQEAADTLLPVLDAMPESVGVNFDPANMILYGMGDPIDAIRKLAPRTRQIHIKDASHTDTPGTWGTEQPAGRGDVDWDAFFGVYREAGLTCDLVVEREGGDARVEDVRAGAALVRAQGLLG